MKVNAGFAVRRTAKLLGASDAPNKIKQNDLFADEINRMTVIHLRYMLFLMTLDQINNTNFKDKKIPELLRLQLKIFALKEI